MIHAEIQTFVKAWDQAWSPVPNTATPADRRAHFEKIAAEMRMETPAGVTTREFQIPVPKNGQAVRVRAFVPPGDPAQPTAKRPAVIYMHGGAWMQGSPETHWDITSRLAAWNKHVVISVDYALAPERPFPAALNDCEAVVCWVADQGPEDGGQLLDVDPQRIAVGGDSAGANLAAALSLVFRDSNISLKAQLLIYPAVDFSTDRPSHIENANGPIVMVAHMAAVNAMYCPNPADLRNPLAAPLRASTHRGLPPAFVAVAEHDPLRDEGVAYAEKLQADGVNVTLDRGPELIHGYLRAMPWSVKASDQLKNMAAWLKAHLTL